MKLDQSELGKEYVILNIAAEEPLSSRLRRLNVYEGGKVTLLGKSLLKKNYLLDCNGVRVGLGKRVLGKIEVKPL